MQTVSCGGRPVSRIPQVRFHKPSGQARVRHKGLETYLGPYGSEEAARRYAAFLTGLASDSTAAPMAVAPVSKSVNGLCLMYLDHAEKYYVKNGKPTDELHCIKSAIRPLLELFGEVRVSEFGPLALKVVRQAMIEKVWTRRYINNSLGRIRRVFRWGVENELVPPAVIQALEAIAPLMAGRTEAKDRAARKPVDQKHINMVLGKVRPLIGDLINLQLLTGARSGELLMLTEGMIDCAGEVWTANLVDHKTVHHGKERVLVFGPKAQLILRPYFTGQKSAKLFRIRRDGYGRAVSNACDALEISRWTPHWLRHTAATRLREDYGLEAAQIMLGHARADMTQLYAALSLSKAVDVARAAG